MTNDRYSALRLLSHITMVCLCAVFLLIGARDASAAGTTFNYVGTGIDEFSIGSGEDVNGSGELEVSAEWVVGQFSANTNKDIYQPNEMISLNGSAVTAACENYGTYLDLSAMVLGTDGEPDATYGVAEIVDSIRSGYQYGTLYGQGVLTAPTTPGIHTIRVEGCHEGDYAFLSGCVYVDITITVAGEALPEPDSLPDISAYFAPFYGQYLGDALPAFVFKFGSDLRYDVWAGNKDYSIPVAEAGFSRVEVDSASNGYEAQDRTKPWEDIPDSTYGVPDNSTTLGAFDVNESREYLGTIPSVDLPVGEYQMRYVVDSNNTLTETNEINNYSMWREVRIIDGSFTEDVVNINAGETADLTWEVRGANGLECGVWSNYQYWEMASDWSVPVTRTTNPLSESTQFVLWCRGGSDSIHLDTIDVIVGGVPVDDAVDGGGDTTGDTTGGTTGDGSGTGSPNLSTNRPVVNEGDNAVLTWETNGDPETGCTLRGGSVDLDGIEMGSVDYGGTEFSGSYLVEGIVATASYTLTCQSGTDVKTIEIAPAGWES